MTNKYFRTIDPDTGYTDIWKIQSGKKRVASPELTKVRFWDSESCPGLDTGKIRPGDWTDREYQNVPFTIKGVDIDELPILSLDKTGDVETILKAIESGDTEIDENVENFQDFC